MDVPIIPQITLELIKKYGITPVKSGKTEGDYPIGSVEDDCQGDIEVGIVSQDVPKVPPGNHWPEANYKMHISNLVWLFIQSWILPRHRMRDFSNGKDFGTLKFIKL